MNNSLAGVLHTLLCLGMFAGALGVDLCGPMYIDPTTFGGRHAGANPVSRFCDTVSLRTEGSWNDVNYAKGWRPLEHLEWFGALDKGQQVVLLALRIIDDEGVGSTLM